MAHIDKDTVPRYIVIISDMEFDSVAESSLRRYKNGRGDEPFVSTFETFKNEMLEAGIPMPITIFWNVESRNGNIPVSKHNIDDVILVSGRSHNTLGNIVSVIEKGVKNNTEYTNAIIDDIVKYYYPSE